MTVFYEFRTNRIDLHYAVARNKCFTVGLKNQKKEMIKYDAQRVYPLPDQFQNARQLIEKGHPDVICLEALIYARWVMTFAVIVFGWCERTTVGKNLACIMELQCKMCLYPRSSKSFAFSTLISSW